MKRKVTVWTTGRFWVDLVLPKNWHLGGFFRRRIRRLHWRVDVDVNTWFCFFDEGLLYNGRRREFFFLVRKAVFFLNKKMLDRAIRMSGWRKHVFVSFCSLLEVFGTQICMWMSQSFGWCPKKYRPSWTCFRLIIQDDTRWTGGWHGICQLHSIWRSLWLRRFLWINGDSLCQVCLRESQRKGCFFFCSGSGWE